MRGYRLFLATTAAAMMGGTLLLAPVSASAQTCPGVSQRQCEDFCGGADQVASCTKTGSEPDCVCEEQTKDVRGNAFGTATTDTAEGQGNLGNKTTTACEGNQGQCKQQ